MPLSTNAFDQIALWLASSIDDAAKDQIRKALDANPESLEDAFYTGLQFGTGGMRGIMGIGTNRINIYTVGMAAQALITYIQRIGSKPASGTPASVVIGYDCRTDSFLFAQECARVVAAAGFTAYLFDALRPTPMVAFGCRFLKAAAGIMITASHNPAIYNGFKVYWADGGQVLNPHDAGIMLELQKLKSPDEIIRAPLDSPLIKLMNIDNEYLDSLPKPLQPELLKEMGSDLKVLYTNLHGTGAAIMPQALKRIGIEKLVFVPQQKEPDGRFPTTKNPDPADESALELGEKMLIAGGFDLLLATDPDGDRLGAVSVADGAIMRLNGNQIFVLMTEYLLKVLSQKNQLPLRAAVIKSFVVTPLIDAICARYGVSVIDTLPGFNNFAGILRLWEKAPESPIFIIGGEESYGTLYGTHVRDKDAIEAARLLVEVAAQAKKNSGSLLDELRRIECEYGIYRDMVVSRRFADTKKGRGEMEASMTAVRQALPTSLAGLKVVEFEDLQKPRSSNSPRSNLSASNVLIFTLCNGARIILRPSGTEAKIKIYIMVKGETEAVCEAVLSRLADAVQEMLVSS